MKKTIVELWRHRELLGALVSRNIKVRYKQTIMGFLWAIFMPLVIIISGLMVKKVMSMLSGTPMGFAQIASVSVKALPWAFFIGAIKSSVNSLVANTGLIKKIYFPRVIFPLSNIFTQLFDTAIASLALSIILIFLKVGVSKHLLLLPLMVFFLILFTTGLGIILSCANVFYRDVRYVVDAILTFGIFFTPVFFDVGMFGKWKTLILLNPVGSILESINSIVVLHKMPDIFWIGYAGACSILIFIFSLKIFYEKESLFAEII